MTETRTEPPKPLEAGGVLDEAVIYDAMWRSTNGTCHPRHVDEMYIWEIAVLLQADDDEVPRPKPEDSSEGPVVKKKDDDRYRYILERVAHARGQGPKPEADPIDPEAFSAIREALS